MIPAYYTCVIPGVPPEYRTAWHPDTETSAPLSRGAFATPGAAIEWARRTLGGTPYTVVLIKPAED